MRKVIQTLDVLFHRMRLGVVALYFGAFFLGCYKISLYPPESKGEKVFIVCANL